MAWFGALALSLILAALPPGGSFIDDDGSVHEGSIEAIAAKNITKGCNPPAHDRFCPTDTVSRQQMATFIVNALDLAPSSIDWFSDDDGSVHEASINALAEAGITKGCGVASDGRFCPTDGVSRQQMATFIANALGLEPMVPPEREKPLPGNPSGTYPVPPEAREVDTSSPDHVVGNGTKSSCTSAAVVAAVAEGGIITFDCGPDPHTIVMSETAKVFNDTGPEIVIDGGGLVTLSGGGNRRILYMNTCDQDQVWTTSHCQNQDHPRLTVQNLVFEDADSTGLEYDGGGAIWVRGGRFKIVNSVFINNSCDPSGPDVGGASVRVFSQFSGLPVYVVNSTFGGGPLFGNTCSNAGGISSIGVSWTVINSLFTDNEATGWGANPSQSGTPGGGSGAAIYNDGNTMTLRVLGTRIERNHANEGGGAIFFVSNDGSGSLIIEDSVLRNNPSDGFETQGYPGIFFLGKGSPQVTNSVLEH